MTSRDDAPAHGPAHGPAHDSGHVPGHAPERTPGHGPGAGAGAEAPECAAFGAHARVWGRDAPARIARLRVCVVGIGGVGSWAVEALARAGVGHLSMVDHDDVDIGNVNRQLHAFPDTLGRSKVELMAERVARINPACDVVPVDDFLAATNIETLLGGGFDAVIDAIDTIRFKAAMIAFCRSRRIRIVTTGGAGGRVDPLAVRIGDLSRTWNDALAAKVRQRLRAEHGFPASPRRPFGVDCVWSTEQPMYPDGAGGVGHAKPGAAGVRLDCDTGYGSVGWVTGTFGLVAASRVVNRALDPDRVPRRPS